MNVLEDIVKACSKEIKEEETNIKQIILTLLSAWTNNPQNTRILAPSGEGKTYLVTKLAELFPQENITILAKATPQSFKYTFCSKKVIENGTGNYQDYDIALKPLEEQLKKTIDRETKKEIEKQIQELKDSVYDLVDFTNKIIVLVDSQSFELFDSIKATLSHDQENLKSFSVNKSKSGTILGQKFVIRGFPAVIYCSAKDEQKRDTTDEINTRFNTISLNTSPKKYRKMLELEAIHSSLPDSIYQEEVISEKEVEELKEKIKQIINYVKDFGKCCNPYGLGIQKLFRDDAGFRTRQFKILNNNIIIHTLANAKFRPKIIHDEIKTPITTRLDIEEACKLTKEPREIQPYKIKFFNDYIRCAILETGKEKHLIDVDFKCLTATELADYITKKGRTADRQKLQESFLKPLVEHGFLDEFQDPDNRTRNIYTLAQGFLNNEASLESTLIDTSMLNTSCLDSFVKKFIEQRYNSESLKILDENDQEITPKELLELLHKIDAQTPKITHKMGSIEASTSIDNFCDVS
ncbi:MAG: hypothetical protein IIA82_09845 [Thaumarchaeota archaeon]|nr:hypothetical protein [Nitrososphaerota archaeon]